MRTAGQFFRAISAGMLLLLGINNQAFAQFAGGDGSSGNPYQIATPTQLDSVRNYLSDHFILTVDIDLNVAPYNTGTGWEPIGDNINPFTGGFDGDGYTISNLSIDNSSQSYQGLFGVVSGGNTFQDLTLTAVDVTGSSNIGGLIGQSKGADINNIHVSGSLSGLYRLGLLIGEVDNSSTTVDSSSSEGNIQSDGGQVGGLIGRLDNGNTVSYGHSYITITDAGNSSFAGGLVGYTGTGSTIAYSYAGGSVEAFQTVGSLVGYNNGTIQDSYATSDAQGTFSGGLVGENTGTLLRTYSTGSVSGIGGPLLGREGGTVTNSYYNSDSAGVADNGFGTGLTTQQMFDSTNYSGWDFTNTWTIVTGDSVSFPYLQSNIPDSIPGKQNVIFAGGDGTSGNPYQIATVTQLDSVRNYLDAHFILTADIDLNVSPYKDGTGWEPIGDNINPFSGGFDGNGHTINKLFIDNSTQDFQGLFGTVSGKNEFKDLSLDSVNVTGRYQVAGLIGDARGANVSNVHISGAVTGVQYTGFFFGRSFSSTSVIDSSSSSGSVISSSNLAGGFIGSIEDTTSVSNSSSSASVQVLNNNGYGGGLIGRAFDNATITNSHATGDITGNNRMGGLIGYSRATIQNSYATGNVTVNGNYNGGLVGVQAANTITDSYSKGKVTTSLDYAGGIAGIIEGTADVSTSYATGDIDGRSYIGGLAGRISANSLVEDSYATGAIDGSSYVGGITGILFGDLTNAYALGRFLGSSTSNVGPLVGFTDNSATITSSYWNSHIFGPTSNPAGTTQTTEELYQEATYTGWDFTSVWSIQEGQSYPYLQSAIPDTIPAATNFYAGGFGSESQPFQISTPDELSKLLEYPYAYFELINDIDLDVAPYNSGTGWEPIGSTFDPFYGTMDGNDYTISKLFINDSSTDYLGLFGVVSGKNEFRDINLDSVNITGRNYVAALIAEARGVNIKKVNASGSVTGQQYVGVAIGRTYSSASSLDSTTTSGSVTANSYAGGLIGGIQDTTSVSNSSSNASVQGSTSGGLVGRTEHTKSTISNSFSTGIVSGSSTIGGLIGYNRATITNSYSTGSVTATNSNAGGLVGYQSDNPISNSYSKSKVSSTSDNVGGLVGSLANSATISTSFASGEVSGRNIIGGLVGNINSNTSVSDSYASGPIDGADYVGGLIGNLSGTLSNSYSVGTVSATGTNNGPVIGNLQSSGTASYVYGNTDIFGPFDTEYGSGLNSDQMSQSGSYPAFNFDSTWTIQAGESYPYLQSLVPDTLPGILVMFSGGVGTESDPFEISNADELDNMRVYRYAHFELVNDVDLDTSPYNSGTGWVPLSSSSVPFYGSLNGNNNSILNLYINDNTLDYASFIGLPSEGLIVKNVQLDSIDVTGKNYVAGLMGTSQGATISNVSLSGDLTGTNYVGMIIGQVQSSTTTIDSSSSSGSVNGNAYLGGLIGDMNAETSLSNSHSSADVQSTTPSDYVGGLTGRVNNSGSDITNSYFNGNAHGRQYVGGLVGYNNGEITGSYSTGEITSTSSASGGLVGYQNSGSITQSYFAGAITSTSNYVGGLVGYALSNSEITNSYVTGKIQGLSLVGGLIGRNQGTISNSYSVRAVTGTTNVQPLIGENTGTVTSSYWNADSSGTSGSWTGTGLSTSAMKQASSFSGWDFNNVWVMLENSAYPYLKNYIPDPIPGYVSPFAGGDGTQTYPYQISTITQLDNIRSYLDDYFVLINNLDLNHAPYNTGNGWEPIGTSASPFTGNFDGQGYSIEGLMISRTTNLIGLFGYTRGAAITDVNLTNADVKGHSLVGGIVGQMDSATVISNSSVQGIIEATGLYAGGMIGYMDSSYVSTSHATDSVKSAGNYVGGLVGFSTNSTTTKSYASNSVTGGSSVGGLIGHSDTTSVVNKSYASGSVHGTDQVGGLVGYQLGASTIENSYSTGDLTGNNYLGGLVGRSVSSSSITNSYSIAAISGNGIKGGLVGSNESSTISSSYWDSLSTGATYGLGADDNAQTAAVLTIPEMMSATSFTGWDFSSDTVWAIIEGGSFPYLENVGTQITTAAAFDGSGGWRTVGQAGDVTYDDLLGHIWTQGFEGSDGGTGASSNVYFFDENSYSWKIPSDSSNYFGTNSASPSDSLRGALIWFYPDDDADGNDDAFPKYLVANTNIRNMDSTFNVPLSYTSSFSSDSSGWNLVSNPYPYSLNWRDVVDAADNKNTLPVAYIWDHSLNSNNGGYKINYGYPLPPGAPEDFFFDGHIPVMQSFWVKASGTGASLTFKPEYQEAAKSPYKQNSGKEKEKGQISDFISIKVEHDEFSDRVLLFPDNGEGINADIPKLNTLAGRFVDMAFVHTDDSRWISGTFTENAVHDFMLDVNSTESGLFTFKLDQVSALSSDIRILLIDQKSGKKMEITEQEEIELNITAPMKRINTPSTLPKLKTGSNDDASFILQVRTGTTVSSELEEEIPESFTLNQNYPNPFNPSSTIRFGLPEASQVRMEVFNILGQKVATLINGDRMNAGWHRVQFNAGSLSSGVYIYRIQAGNFVQTKRMMLIK